MPYTKVILDLLDHFEPHAETLYKFAIEKWPIPDAFGYRIYDPGLPSALLILCAVSQLDETDAGLWPSELSGLPPNHAFMFKALTMLVECSDEVFQKIKRETSKTTNALVHSLIPMAEPYRKNAITGAAQYNADLSGIVTVFWNRVEWTVEQIAADLRRIYTQSELRCFSGQVSGDDRIKLIKSVRVPELWHVVLTGPFAYLPFEVIAWMATQKDCDEGSAISIMFSLTLDATSGHPSSQPQIELLGQIWKNCRKGYYKKGELPAQIPTWAQDSKRDDIQKVVKFAETYNKGKANITPRDILVGWGDDGDLTVSMFNHTFYETSDRKADPAFAHEPASGFIRKILAGGFGKVFGN